MRLSYKKKTVVFKSIALLLINLLALVGGLLLSAYGIKHSLALYAVGVIITGSLQFILGFAMPHWAIHGTLFFNKKRNKVVANIFLISMSFRTFDFYSEFHKYHHIFTKNKEKDPGEEQYLFWGLKESMKYRYVMYIHPLFLIISGNDILRIFRDCKANKELKKTLIYCRGTFLIGTFITNTFLYFVLLRIIPLFTTRFLVSYRSEVSDHWGDTRTRNSIGLFLFWILRGPFGRYDGYHHLHHKHPEIPWSELPHIYESTKQEEGLTYFSDYINK